MSERFVPLLDARVRSVALPPSAQIRPALGHITDALQRPLRDLRISVTDRCNFRCTYCMPFDEYQWMDRHEVLSFEEIERLARLFLDFGIQKVRLTGGEPLVRKDLPRLIAGLRR